MALSSGTAMPARAQMPVPPSPEAAEIAACLCLQRAVEALGTAMADRERAYEASRREVADLDVQLQNSRMVLNVEDPAAVAQFRQLLDRRDVAQRYSSGTLFAQYQEAVMRYNERVAEYNARCADRPRNPILLNQVRATLVCPPLP
jgi:histone H3/H4